MSKLEVKPLLVLCLLLLSPSGAKAQLREVEVAAFLELQGNFDANAEARLIAVHLAMECIRTGSTKHCPACAEIQNRQTQLVLRQWDAGTTKQSAVETAVAIIAKYPNITGFIGPQFSGISEAVADRVLIPGSGLGPLAVVSPSATNAALAQKPNFFRTVPSDAVVCRSIMQVTVNLRYRDIVGVVEASGGWPQGINRKMLEISSEFDVQYTAIEFSGTNFAAELTEDLSRQNPAVILGVGKDTEDTYLLFQLLYNLRAGGVLACRLLMGGDLIAGGAAPRFRDNTNDVKYFAGVVSFKASGSGERLEQWKRDWPAMVRELDLDTILTTEDSVKHQIPSEHLDTPPSYCPEIFEATILYALAAALNPGLPMTSAIRLLPLGGFRCLDQQPVRLDQSGDRIGNLVSIFQHRRDGVFVPDVIGDWSLTDSAVRLEPQGALDDLANNPSNPVVPTTTTLPVNDNLLGLLPWIICIVILLLFVAILGFICVCHGRLPLCLQCCLPMHLRPKAKLEKPDPEPPDDELEKGMAPRSSSCEEVTATMLGRPIPAPGTEPEPFHTASPLQPVTCGWEKLEIYGSQTRWKHAVFKERNTGRPTSVLIQEPDAKTTRMLLEDRVQRQTLRDPCRAEIQFMGRFILTDAVPESTNPGHIAHAKKTVVVQAGEEPLTGENVSRLDVCLNTLIVDIIPVQQGQRQPQLALVDKTMYIDVSDDETNSEQRADACDQHTSCLPSSSTGSLQHLDRGLAQTGGVRHEPPLHVKFQVTPISDSPPASNSKDTGFDSGNASTRTGSPLASDAEDSMLDPGNASTGRSSPLASDAEVSVPSHKAASSSTGPLPPQESMAADAYQVVQCEGEGESGSETEGYVHVQTPEEPDPWHFYELLNPWHLSEVLNTLRCSSNNERATGGDVQQDYGDIPRTPDPFD